MLVHHEVVERRGERALVDHGIRTHGSVSYPSILHGQSHGCHRLLNHLALRLAGFLLRHRPHERLGPMPGFTKIVRWRGETFAIRVPSRGTLFELTPPVPVRVFEGRIRGRAQQPSTRWMPAH